MGVWSHQEAKAHIILTAFSSSRLTRLTLSSYRCWKEPPLGDNVEAKVIVKSYEGWDNFCLSYGLKPWDPEENEEAERILMQLASAHRQDKEGTKQEGEDKQSGDKTSEK